MAAAGYGDVARCAKRSAQFGMRNLECGIKIARHPEHYALPCNAKCKMQNAKLYLARHAEQRRALTVMIGYSAKHLHYVGSFNQGALRVHH